MSNRTKIFALFAALLAYTGLSSWCFFAPHTVSSASTCSVIGPSANLIWGAEALPWFLGESAVLAACVIGATFRRSLRALLTAAAALVWLLGGFLAYAVSV